MIDLTTKIAVLESLISDLDPRLHEVAIAHLNDAIDALHATTTGRPTRYARSADLVDGAVAKKGTVRLFK